MESDPFGAFMEKFTEEGGEYVPKDQSDNSYRHFGIKRGRRLYLSHDELLYLYSRHPPEPCTLRTRAYFELKNDDKNVLCDEAGSLRVYHRTKHFRRDEASPIGVLEYRHRDDEFLAVSERSIVCVTGEDTFCFIDLEPVESLCFETDTNLYK